VLKASPKEASGDMKSVAVCVANRIREQRFPDPPGGSFASVDYPFVFSKQ